MFHLNREYDRAIDEAQRCIEMDPTNFPCHAMLGRSLCEQRSFDRGVAALRSAYVLSGHSLARAGFLGLGLAESGQREEARLLLHELHGAATRGYVPPSSFAWIHVGLGETDQAFEWLDKAIEARDPMVVGIKSYAFLDPLRSDPRFAALLGKMNLA